MTVFAQNQNTATWLPVGGWRNSSSKPAALTLAMLKAASNPNRVINRLLIGMLIIAGRFRV
ncbi:MAG: hypothetical protein NTZ16_08615 [Verrucomicrobia bacterium]|nr:hypothetical protein [Verrucomicrobiota bacterium]